MAMVSLAVFIFLLLFVLFRRKCKKGRVLKREEKILAWIGVGLLILSVIPDYFQFFSITSSTFSPYLGVILVILPILAILIIVTAVYSRRKGIRRFFTVRYHNKLKHKITEELETEAVIKNIAFSRQPKGAVLSILANRVSYDIMETQTPKNYHAQPSEERDGDVWIDKDMLTLPLPSAEVLAAKMTQLSEDPKYRKKWKLLLLP